jgi:hypothetical protein
MRDIKKIICCILTIFMITSIVACKKGKEKEEEAKSEKDSFDIKIATNIVETYMGYMVENDMESAKKLYSKELAKKNKATIETDLKIFGFKMDEVNEVGKSGVFKIRVTKATTDKPSATLDMYNIKIEKEENEYKIKEINSMTEKDAFFEEDALRIRDKNNVKTNLLIDKSGIPQYTYSKDDKAQVNKTSVPKSKFGVIDFSYSGERIAISTYDKDSYIAVVKIDETQATQGSGADGGAGGASGGSQGQQGGSKTKVRETPVGKEITSVDYIKDCKIELLTFSLEEKFMLVQYDKGQLGKSLRLYDTDSGDLIPVSFEEKFPIGKVNVVFSSFGKDVLTFEVNETKNTTKSESQLIGKWQIDLKEYNVKKL